MVLNIKLRLLFFIILFNCCNRVEKKYELLIGQPFVELMTIINQKGEFLKSIKQNGARVFKLNEIYLISPVDYYNQYSIVTENADLMNEWIESGRFPVPFVEGKTFHFEKSKVIKLNSRSQVVLDELFQKIGMDTTNLKWDKERIELFEKRIIKFGKNRVFEDYALGFSIVISEILKAKGIEPVWYIEKVNMALNPVYLPVCIDSKSDSEIKIYKLVVDYLLGELNDLNFQIDLMSGAKRTFVRKSEYREIEFIQCE